jgi:hypothetical protein
MISFAVTIATVSFIALPFYFSGLFVLSRKSCYAIPVSIIATSAILGLYVLQLISLCLFERDPNFLILWLTGPTTTCILYLSQLFVVRMNWGRTMPNSNRVDAMLLIITVLVLVSMIAALFLAKLQYIPISLGLALEVFSVLSRLVISLSCSFFFAIRSVEHFRNTTYFKRVQEGPLSDD